MPTLIADLPTSTEELEQELARRKHLKFMQYCWRDLSRPLLIGFHTKIICGRIDQALVDFRNGKSTHIAIAVHHRSGKSEIVAGNLAPHFLGEFPGKEVMSVTYAAARAYQWARKARSLLEDAEFQSLYPKVTLSHESRAVNRWEVAVDGKNTHSGFLASGLRSGLTGSGAHLAILDDYLSGRKAAESQLLRDNAWMAVTNDLMTRLAPVHIVVILATWWHFDDVRGRIVNITNPEHDDYDPMFPKFEFIDFPAKAEDYADLQRRNGKEDFERYPGDYLFDHIFNEEDETWEPSPEDWFDAEWYEQQYATLQPYSAAGIMDCNPTPRSGNILDVSKIVVHPMLEDIPKEIRDTLRWHRVWDYAHTAKQRVGDDPDYSGGTLLAVRRIGYNAALKEVEWEFYIRDYTEFRAQATERDARIRKIAKSDGPKVRILVESSLDSKDGADYLKHQLLGLRPVTPVNCKGDKVTRITPVEPIFSAGRVHVIRGAWVKNWKTKLQQFDGSGATHDEPVDNLSCAYQALCKGSGYQKLRDPMS